MKRGLLLIVIVLALSVASAMPNVSAAYGGSCNSEYPSYYEITGTDSSLLGFFYVNGTGWSQNGVMQRAICNSTANALCLDPTNESAYQCFNDDVKVWMHVVEGNGTDYGSLPSDITMLLSFNDSTDATGLSVAENNFDGDERVDGVVGYGYTLADGSDYMTVSNHPAYTDFTVCYWWKSTDVTAASKQFSKYNSYAWGGGIDLIHRCPDNPAGDCLWYAGDAGGANYHSQTIEIGNYSNNVWAFDCLMGDASNYIRFYHDGIKIADKTISSGFDSGTEAFYIHQENGGIGGTITYDEFITFNDLKTDNELAALYNNTNDDGYALLSSITTIGNVPEYSNPQFTPASPQTYDAVTPILFNITWTDSDNSIDYAYIEHNFTGTSQQTNMTNTTTLYNLTLDIPYMAGYFEFRYCAVDETPLSNCTAYYNYTINTATSGLAVSASPSWSVAENTAVTITCSNSVGQTMTLKRDGSVVSNPYTATLGFGTYSFNCNIADTQNYTTTSVANTLIVQAGGFGCTDTDTYAFSKILSIAGNNTINLNFTDIVEDGYVKDDLSDVYVNTSSITTNINGSYLVVNVSNVSSIQVLFGNYIVNHTRTAADLGSYTDDMTGYTQINNYIDFDIIDEVSGSELLPQSANNTMTLYCSGGASTFDFINTSFLVASFEQVNSARATVQYASDDLYFRDYFIDSPVEYQAVYLVDATEWQVVRQVYWLDDITGDFDSSDFIVMKQLEGSLVTITELSFDTEDKVIVYLMNAQQYQLYIDNDVEVRNIGLIYVDSGDLEKTITIGEVTAMNTTHANVSFTPPTWDNVSQIYMIWQDASERTTLVEFEVYNASDDSLLYNATCTDTGYCSFAYTVPSTSQNYNVKYAIHHEYYGDAFTGMIPIILTFVAPAVTFPLIVLLAQLGASSIGGTGLWMFLIMLVPIPLMFKARYAGLGAFATLGAALLLARWGDWTITATVAGLGLFMSVMIELSARRRQGRT